MHASIVAIGNSQGIRIPKPLLTRSGLSGDVELSARRGEITVRAARRPRADWEAAFRRMAARGDDKLLDPEVQRETKWDHDEWRW